MKKLPIILIASLVGTGFLISGCSNIEKKPMAAEKIPLENFFKNPEKSGYQISPNGKYFSFVAPYENRMNVFIQERGKEDALRITGETDRDIRSYFWANNEQILYLKDNGGDENFKLYGVNIDGSNQKCFTDFDGVVTQVLDELPEISNEMIIGLNKRIPQVFDPYRLDLTTGEMTMLAENPGNIQAWMFDHDGKLRMAVAIVDGVNASILYRATEQDEWNPILTTSFKESVSPVFFTFDNQNVYALSNLNRDKTALVILDVNDGSEKEVLYEIDDYDLTNVFYSRKRKVLTGVAWEGALVQRHYFDDQAKNLRTKLESQLPDYNVAITSSNREEDIHIVRTYSDRSLGNYYVYDESSDKLDMIVEVSPWLDENEMGKQFPIKYMSRDGLTIEGYLTLPKGYTPETAKNLPVVVNPHGGPWARDSWGFNPEIQFLANRGYAVLQMNFRGSTGFGKKFWEASFQKWGREMQDDITDGTKWLIEKGIADPEKIAIYGGSYGGYATLMGLVKEPELYAAGVDYVGVSNMFTFMKTIPPYWEPLLQMMYEMVGNPEKDSAMLAEVSPVLHADKIIAPLFVAQGAKDPRVNIDEADQMVAAMKARGVEVEYMVKENEGHGFGNEENRFDFYRAMESFLEKHLK
jgi:dipeptidyl aminopeptidase/acylaminoacyl peptidase